MKCFLIFTIFVVSAIRTSVVSQQVIHHHHHRFVTAGPQHSNARYVLNPQQQAAASASQGHPGHGHGHSHPGSVQYSVVHSQSPSPHPQVQPAQQRVSTSSSSELDAKKIHEQFVAAFQAQQRLAHSLPPQQQIQQQLAPAPSPSAAAPIHAAAAGRGVPVAQQVPGYPPQPQVVQYFVRHTPARIVNSYQPLGQYQVTTSGVKSPLPPPATVQQQQEAQPHVIQQQQQQPQFLVSPRPAQYQYSLPPPQGHPLLLAQPQAARTIVTGPSMAPYLQPQIVHHHHVPQPQQQQHFPVQITQHAYSGVQPGIVTQYAPAAPQPQHYSQAISTAAIRNMNQVAVNKVVTPVVTKASNNQIHSEPAISVGKVQGFAHSTAGPSRVADLQFNTAYTAFSRPMIGQNGPVTFSAPIDGGAGTGGRVGADAILSLFRNGGFAGPTSPSQARIPVTAHHHHAHASAAGQVAFSQIIPQQPTRVTLMGGGDEIESVPKLENIQVYHQSPASSSSLQLQNYQNYQQQVQQLEFQQIQQQRQEQQQQQHHHHQQQLISATGPPPPPSSYYTIRHHAVPQIDGLSPLPNPVSDNRIQSEFSAVSAAASAVAQSQAAQGQYANLGNSLQELTSDILSNYNLK